MKQQSTFTKTTFILGIVFLVYGFLSRMVPINFFWESKSIGWTLILVALIGLLIDEVKYRRLVNRKVLWPKIGIGLICFIFFVQLMLIFILPNTDAYKISQEYIKNNEEIKTELGEITGFGLIPTGGISITSDSNGKMGNANINFIVKGEKAYKSVTVFSEKEYETNWRVVQLK